MKNKHIIIIDDDQAILESFRVILEDEGYNVDTGANGPELQRLLSRNIPDLILLDYSLPGDNADVLIRQMRHDTEFKNIPIIVISANAKSRMYTKLSGVDDFLEKPIEIPYLLSRIKRYFA